MMQWGYGVSHNVRKLIHEVEKFGKEYTFTKYVKNEFNEVQISEPLQEVTIKGIYHFMTWNAGYVGMYEFDPSRVENERMPSIMCTHKVFEGTGIALDDTVIVNGKLHRVIALINPGEANIAINICLEMVRE